MRRTKATQSKGEESLVEKLVGLAGSLGWIALVAVVLAVLTLLTPGMAIVAIVSLPFRIAGFVMSRLILLVLASICSLSVFLLLRRKSKDLGDAAGAYVLIGGAILLVTGVLAIGGIGWASDFYALFFGNEPTPKVLSGRSISRDDLELAIEGGFLAVMGITFFVLGRWCHHRKMWVGAYGALFIGVLCSASVIAVCVWKFFPDLFEKDSDIHPAAAPAVAADVKAVRSRSAATSTQERAQPFSQRMQSSEKKQAIDRLEAQEADVEPSSHSPSSAFSLMSSSSGRADSDAFESKAEPQPSTSPGATPIAARPRTPAEIAWGNADWSEAFSQYSKSAEAGDADAQVRLGIIYFDGLGRRVDFRLAEKWFKKAAETGNPEAKYRLGLLYGDEREGAPWDLAVARRYFTEAAEINADAAVKLGQYYWNGIGVPENKAEARRWYLRGAKLGSSEAADWLRSNR